MTERDLTRVMTEHVADVHLPEEAVRRIRMAAKEEKPEKRKMGLAVALVLALMLLTGVAVAAGMGVLDYLRVWTPYAAPLPGAEQLVEANLGQCETEHAVFTIREAVSDGRGVSIMVEVVPKEAGTLLMPESASEDSIKYNTDMTYAAYAEAHGYQRLIPVRCQPDPAASYSSCCIEGDDSITLIINFAPPNGMEALALRCISSDGTYSRTFGTKIDLTLPTAAPLWTAERELNEDVPEFGVHIDRIRLTCTPLALYAEVDWTVLEDDGKTVWFDLADAQGTELPFNPLVVSGLRQQHDAQKRYMICSQPLGAAPSSLTLIVRAEDGCQWIPFELP